jgi:hypothetical protein
VTANLAIANSSSGVQSIGGVGVDAETTFKRELEMFDREADAATQFFYAYLAVHAAMGDREPVRALLNTASLFWATILGALQQSTFITLGRIFDKDDRSHSVYRLLKLVEKTPHLFSREALRQRREREAGASEWLPGFLARAHEPTADDFRKLRVHADKWRDVYEARYAPIRKKHFAHRDRIDTSALFAKTNIREIQLLLRFLRQLENALWEMFTNGRKPVLRAERYSAQGMRARPSKPGYGGSLQERIMKEAEQFLVAAASRREGAG